MSGQVAQMFEQALDALKGWFGIGSLDKAAPMLQALLDAATATPAGRGGFIDANGNMDVGPTGNQMPIYLWNGSNHPDVSNPGTSPVTSTTHWVAISPTGIVSGLVATGGYEIQTTEFDGDQSYAANDPLTSDANGVMTNESVNPGVTHICGLASFHQQGDVNQAAATSPVGNNAHGVSVLSFWSYFLPAALST